MSAPSLCRLKKRPASKIRRVDVLGKKYQDATYKPQYALGIMCRDEADQATLHSRLNRQLKRDIKVLVI